MRRAARRHETWIDSKDISRTAEWLQEILRNIGIGQILACGDNFASISGSSKNALL
jgi:hypothetical protein